MSIDENEEMFTVRLTRTEVKRLHEVTLDGVLWLEQSNGYNEDTGSWDDKGYLDRHHMTLTEVNDLLEKFNETNCP